MTLLRRTRGRTPSPFPARGRTPSIPLNTQRPLLVGLAGGVASGKSTCARLLAGADGAVIDADAIVHQLQSEASVVDTIEGALGERVRASDGTLDREATARVVFGRPEKLRALEGVLHPLVRARIEARVAALRAGADGAGVPALVVLDVPLLFESGMAEACDVVVFVDSDPASRAARASRDRGWSDGEVARREASQRSLDEKRRKAQHVIPNTGSVGDLESAVHRLRREILSRR